MIYFAITTKKLVIKNAQEIVSAFPQSVLYNKTFTSNQRQISKMYCCCFVIVDKQWGSKCLWYFPLLKNIWVFQIFFTIFFTILSSLRKTIAPHTIIKMKSNSWLSRLHSKPVTNLSRKNHLQLFIPTCKTLSLQCIKHGAYPLGPLR
jgi:hypothetical protein